MSGRVLRALLGVALVLVLSAPTAIAVTLPSPTAWPLDRIEVTAGFDPPEQSWGVGHRGVDLAASPGQPVRAAAGGTVTVARLVAGRGVVVIDHGALRTTYEPVSALVAEGDQLSAGALIGRITTGGHCSNRCLHWGLREGDTYLDPLLLAPSGAGSARVRLLGGDEREHARHAAAERAAQLRRAAIVAAAHFTAAGQGDFRHPVAGGITSGFGMRQHPVLHVWKLHDGTDFGAPCGSPIVAAAAGRVSGGGASRGYGNRLMIDHGQVGGRAVVTGYNHAQRYVVGRGEVVRAGQLIGYVGATGYATGCHLHLMVWLDGRLTNPMTWFSP